MPGVFAILVLAVVLLVYFCRKRTRKRLEDMLLRESPTTPEGDIENLYQAHQQLKDREEELAREIEETRREGRSVAAVLNEFEGRARD